MPLAADLRIAARALRRQPGFAAGVALVLALGIGPNAAIYSAVEALLVRPLPFPDAERLVRIVSVRGGEPGSLSYREIQDMRALDRVFVDVAKYTDQGQYNASGDGRPEELPATITTGNLFAVLGVAPAIGATWPATADHVRGFNLVISHELWQRRFAGDRGILGRSMTLDGAPGYTIVGVLPRGFAFPARADLYRSHGISPNADAYEDRSIRGGWGVARLRDGVTLTQANAALERLGQRLAREHPASSTGVSFRAAPLRDLYAGEARPYLLLLLAAVSLVFLVACANVGNLLLARAFGREREIAVRLAIGAPRATVVRFVMLEALLLALLGGTLGIALAAAGTRALATLVRAELPTWMAIELSGRVLVYGLAATLAAALLVGAIPASRLVRGDLTDALRSGARGASASRRHRRVRATLVVAEVALAVALLVGTGLMTRSFQALVRTPTGIDPDSVLTFRVELGWRAYPPARGHEFRRQLVERLGALPGVVHAGVVDLPPLAGRPKSDEEIGLLGQGDADRRDNPFVNARVASPGVFGVLRIPLVRGRLFTDADRDSAPRVAVVSRATAARLWPGRDPIGTRFQLSGTDTASSPWWTVVGIVGDVRHESLSAPPSLDVWLPFAQQHTGSHYAVLRMRGADPLLHARRAPELVWAIDPDQSFFDVRTMRERVDDRIWVPRLAGVLFASFGVLAVALAAAGVFAVLAYSVSQRTRELGVRQALGASPARLARQVMTEGLRLTALGGVVGMAGAILVAVGLRHLLFGVGALDLPTLVAVPVVLLAVATVACWLPGRRAMRVTPLEALRAEG